MNGTKASKEFTDLRAWQEGHKFVIVLYRATEHFPEKESFGLTSQMRRAAVSITSNIAEGFGRRGYKEKLQFYYLAHGSLTEVKNQLLIARDVRYLSGSEHEELAAQLAAAHQLLQGLIQKTKSIIRDS